MKSLSCGILIYDGTKILLCHATGQSHWDIPKGHLEEGETQIEAAIRECFEETGFLINPEDLIDCGFHEYNNHKDLHLYGYKGPVFPKVEECKCTSVFTHPKHNKDFPEVDDYKYVDIDNLIDFVTHNLYTVLEELIFLLRIKK